MSEFLQGFAAKLEPSMDTADGADWALLEQILPEHITEPVPMCLFRSAEVKDPDTGEMLERQFPVMEVMNVMAWVMIHKINPVMTEEDVARGITRENRADMLDDIWEFWTGTKLRDDEEEVEFDDENPTESLGIEIKNALDEAQSESPEESNGEP